MTALIPFIIFFSRFVLQGSAQQTVIYPGYGFSWFGCYNDVATRALNGAFTSGSNMTVEYCASYCQGFNYMAVGDGNTCYCGNQVDPYSHQVITESGKSCTDNRYTCTGNSSVRLLKLYDVRTDYGSGVLWRQRYTGYVLEARPDNNSCRAVRHGKFQLCHRLASRAPGRALCICRLLSRSRLPQSDFEWPELPECLKYCRVMSIILQQLHVFCGGRC